MKNSLVVFYKFKDLIFLNAVDYFFLIESTEINIILPQLFQDCFINFSFPSAVSLRILLEGILNIHENPNMILQLIKPNSIFD
jgi:hypothetical protein